MALVDHCVFCKIVRGELPATVLYEDEQVIALLDIAPITPGHTLLVPKAHHVSLTTVPPALVAHLFALAPRLAQALVRACDGDGFNLFLANGDCAGQTVPHAHLHLIPRSGTDGFAWGWRCRPYADAATPAAIAAKFQTRWQAAAHDHEPDAT